MRILSALVMSALFAGPALAQPTLAELFGKVADSTREVTRSAAEVEKARRAYEEQQQRVIEAARALSGLFGGETDEPRPQSRLAKLLELSPTAGVATPRLVPLRLGNAPVVSRLALLQPKPTSATNRLALFQTQPKVGSLRLGAGVLRPLQVKALAPLRATAWKPPVTPKLAALRDVRDANPNGTSIYDRLTFRR